MANPTVEETVVSDDYGLRQDILAVFRRAYAERQLDVAEHLLRALEAMDGVRSAEDDFLGCPSVAAAYGLLVDRPEA